MKLILMMKPILTLFFILFFTYFLSVFFVKLAKNCSWREAREIIAALLASLLKENEYDLSTDSNYLHDLNKIIMDVVGTQRYQQLCDLDILAPTISFNNKHSGTPSVCISVKPNDDSEKLQLEYLIRSTTEIYLENYNLGKTVTKLSWEDNKVLGIPMIVIYYPTNDIQYEALIKSKHYEVKNTLSSMNDILDDEEDLI